jgi:MFS superfamily sulfate permease-like transporter
MKIENKNRHIKGIFKDLAICILIFSVISFLDFEIAFFISILCFSIMLPRRILTELNPNILKGQNIYFRSKNLTPPKGVDIFDLNSSKSIVDLSKYVDILFNIIVHPRVLIIRFKNKFEMSDYEIVILFQIINQLEKIHVNLILSDVHATLQNKFRENGISEKVNDANIFYYISDAINKSNDFIIPK